MFLAYFKKRSFVRKRQLLLAGYLTWTHSNSGHQADLDSPVMVQTLNFIRLIGILNFGTFRVC